MYVMLSGMSACDQHARMESKHVARGIMLPSSSVRTFWVYMLQCGDGSYYSGVTNNLEERVAMHKEGLDPRAYTYQHRPVELVHSEEYGSINDAIRREKQLQGWSRKKKEALIKGDFEKLQALAKRRTS